MNPINDDNIIVRTDRVTLYKTGGRALKVFAPGYSDYHVFGEAAMYVRIRQEGIAIPEIYGVHRLPDGRWAVEQELIEGVTLQDIMNEQPENLEEQLEFLAEVQCGLNLIGISDIPRQKTQMERLISSLKEIDGVKRYHLLGQLDKLPQHTSLCHGNLSPENIMITEAGTPYVLSWLYAARGNACADAARTYHNLCCVSTEAAEQYIGVYCARSGIAPEFVREWLPIAAASQLALGNISELQKSLLMTWLDMVYGTDFFLS